jgi:hypothetical protein
MHGLMTALHMHGFMKWQRAPRAPTIMSRKGPAVDIPPQITEYSVYLVQSQTYLGWHFSYCPITPETKVNDDLNNLRYILNNIAEIFLPGKLRRKHSQIKHKHTLVIH